MNANDEALSLQHFWDFSLKFYKLDNNQSDLLLLQDEADVNVNQCLLLFFLLELGFVLSIEQCSALDLALEESELATEHLRSKRRQAGQLDKASQQYKDALEQEIASEKIQQEALLNCLKGFAASLHVVDEHAESFMIKYLVACLNHLSLSRHYNKNQEFGQSSILCINQCVERLVASYLGARPFVFH